MLANAVGQAHQLGLTPPVRQQAGSYICCVLELLPGFVHLPVILVFAEITALPAISGCCWGTAFARDSGLLRGLL